MQGAMLFNIIHYLQQLADVQSLVTAAGQVLELHHQREMHSTQMQPQGMATLSPGPFAPAISVKQCSNLTVS